METTWEKESLVVNRGAMRRKPRVDEPPACSRGQAQTVLLDRPTHAAFDRCWKD